jgi:hypothetical protein
MSDDLEQQNEMADSLIQKLERIKELWEELPTQDEIDELAKSAHSVAVCLVEALETYLDGDFPTVESLQEVGREAATLAEGVDAGMEVTYDAS